MTKAEAIQKQMLYGLKKLKQLEAREELLKTIEDWPSWLKLLDMDVDKGEEAFYDSRRKSPHEDFRRALDDKSIQQMGVFMPRGVGKTYSVLLPWVTREIVRNPEITILMGSEAEKLAVEQRTTWIRSHLMLLEEKGFGPFRSKQWKEDRFTVERPSGVGGQPTVVAWGPSSAGTGRHWQYGIFDDLYGEMSAESPAVRATVTRKFIRIFGQRMRNTRMIVVGTMWPGRETYYYKMRADPKVSKHWKVMSYQDRDAKGRILFKCLTPEFLARQKDEMPPALYRSQYKNKVVDDDELTFEAEDFHVGNPPADVKLSTHIVTDSAFSVQTDRKASYSAIAIIQKTPDNVAYVMDLRMGRWPADRFPRELIGMAQEWRAKGHPPLWYCMENQGPGGQYPAHIADVETLLGVDHLQCHPVSHAKANKTARIELSRGPIRSGKIVFSPDLDREVFLKLPGQEPTGICGQEYMEFAHDSNLRFDGADAISDAQAKDRYGLWLCPPPDLERIKKPSTLYTRSLAKLNRHQRVISLY